MSGKRQLKKYINNCPWNKYNVSAYSKYSSQLAPLHMNFCADLQSKLLVCSDISKIIHKTEVKKKLPVYYIFIKTFVRIKSLLNRI